MIDENGRRVFNAGDPDKPWHIGLNLVYDYKGYKSHAPRLGHKQEGEDKEQWDREGRL